MGLVCQGPVQERHDHTPLAGDERPEGSVRSTGGDTVVYGPKHGIVEVIAGVHIGEGVGRGRNLRLAGAGVERNNNSEVKICREQPELATSPGCFMPYSLSYFAHSGRNRASTGHPSQHLLQDRHSFASPPKTTLPLDNFTGKLHPHRLLVPPGGCGLTASAPPCGPSPAGGCERWSGPVVWDRLA